MASPTTLRVINYRLTTTPVKQLPYLVDFLASSLGECGDILSASPRQKNGQPEADNALQVHKLKTRVTSLLQDRNIEGRWSAVILIKTLVEAGQWEILRESEPWVRGLINILAKPDPISTKKLSIITLNRIFNLTYQYPTLVREITTPSLPAFITSSLNLVSIKPSSEPSRILRPEAPLLEVVLLAFSDLISRHPTTFRPFSAQIHSLLVTIIGSPTFPKPFPVSVLRLAQRLFISLHNCAPKNTSGDEWTKACKLTIKSVHQTADFVFRAVVEQWEPGDQSDHQPRRPRDFSQSLGDDAPNPLGLPGWHGIRIGADRLKTLLYFLSSFVTSRTASTVNVPVAAFLDLTSRLTSLQVPVARSDVSQSSLQLNTEIGREEREELWSELPGIHVACLDLFSTMVLTFRNSIISVAQNMLEQALWVFEAEAFHKEVRVASYHLIANLLPWLGPSMTKPTISALSPLVRSCCQDLLSDLTSNVSNSSEPKIKPKGNQNSVNADSFLNSTVRGNYQTAPFPVYAAAYQLLSTLLSWLPLEHLPPPLRAEIDRTAILTGDHDAMLSSVLNPTPVAKGRRGNPSILPFLTRRYPDRMAVECLLRPRMPILTGAPVIIRSIMEGDEDEAEGEDGEWVVPTYQKNANKDLLEHPTSAPIDRIHERSEEADNLWHAGSKRDFLANANVAKLSGLSASQSQVDDGAPITKKARGDTEPYVSSLTSHAHLKQAPSTPEVAPLTSVSGDPALPVTQKDSLSRAIDEPTSTLQKSGPTSLSRTPPTNAVPSNSIQLGRGVEHDEDSEDGIPTLNIEPDTDEEETGDEDVSMQY
ncbi:hypothetical protein Egran_04780 [Elaphomyces granulatus]|uniref:Pre-rRNA-processing protein RIX1 n=1 Tax=Elaphomyces granulatus TaxID=519963 RepID=A0A232LTG8_9EURO|nr:hypothetical protein Egran_04780 [Elaphomyces granulatus]